MNSIKVTRQRRSSGSEAAHQVRRFCTTFVGYWSSTGSRFRPFNWWKSVDRKQSCPVVQLVNVSLAEMPRAGSVTHLMQTCLD